jgi:predicted aminopeptidase
MRAAQPIEQVIAAPKTSDRLRAQLKLLSEVRAFAVSELGLPDNRSYTRYADVGRPYLVWNVVAAPEFSLQPERWCFPVTGCIAYRGYFRQASAARYAARLERRGLDVMVGGVPAYSTLGRFADPIPNTLLRFGEIGAAATIIHELAHQLLYVPGDSSFNESFANAVEEVGIERWLRQRGAVAELDKLAAQRTVERGFNELFARFHRELTTWYASGATLETLRAGKEQRLRALADELSALAARSGRGTVYRDWIASGLNNAHLVAVATYQSCVAGFRRVLTEEQGDLPRFYARVRQIAALAPDERHRAVCS